MDQKTAAQKAANLGAILAAVYIGSGVFLWGAYEKAYFERTATEETGAKQTALAEKQREVQGLSQQVATQRTVIKELSSRSGSIQSVDAGQWQEFTATWYSPRGGQGDGHTTFSGAPVKQEWTVAVDPKVIPLGSLIEVRYPDGTDRLYRATDTGGAVKGKHIDVFDWDERKCLQNGVQTVMVRILVKGR